MEINEIIRQAEISERARDTALRIFGILAKAEAEAHGVPENEVHFHEVGAVDSIIDVVAAAICLDDLDITEVIIPFLCEGGGMVRCQHGMMPIPVPAVTNIIRSCKLPVRPIGEEGEFVTPTGAAIAAAIRTKGQLPRQYQVLSSGMGAGKRNYARPSILRGMLLREQESDSVDVWKLESNIDDSTGEALGFTAELLMENGAADVYYAQIFMKKNRPGVMLSCLCRPGDADRLAREMLRHTSTFGVRRTDCARYAMAVSVERLSGEGGTFLRKTGTGYGLTKSKPEYAPLAALAQAEHVPLEHVREMYFRADSD